MLTHAGKVGLADGRRRLRRVLSVGGACVVFAALLILGMGGGRPAAADPGYVNYRLPIAESRFGTQTPPGWPAEFAASWDLEVPESCLVEMIFELPDREKL